MSSSAHTTPDLECLFISWLNTPNSFRHLEGMVSRSFTFSSRLILQDKVLIKRKWELTVARVRGSSNGLLLPKKSGGKVWSVCVQGMQTRKARKRETRCWLGVWTHCPPRAPPHLLCGSRASLGQPEGEKLSGLTQDCCNCAASWLTATMLVLLKHSFHPASSPA